MIGSVLRQYKLLMVPLLILTTMLVVFNWPVVRTYVFRLQAGVKPGVTLAGKPVGRMLPDELLAFLEQLRENTRKQPCDAAYDQHNRRIIPDKDGHELDVERTFEKVMSAPGGAEIQPEFRLLRAKVTKEFFQAVRRGPANRPCVSIGINVDWGEDVLPQILSTLDEYGVKATFFLTGRWARKFPDMARAIAGQGHEIGNHGMQHSHPEQLTAEELESLITDNEQLLFDITGIRTRLFAPPYGEVNQRIVTVSASLGYRTILWTVDSVDWRNPSADQIRKKILDNTTNGAIFLFHPKENTARALPEILLGLRKRGIKPVTVTELLEGL